jgi:hypothetical protein
MVPGSSGVGVTLLAATTTRQPARPNCVEVEGENNSMSLHGSSKQKGTNRKSKLAANAPRRPGHDGHSAREQRRHGWLSFVFVFQFLLFSGCLTMDDEAKAHLLYWTDGNTDESLRQLRERVSTLQQLHVECVLHPFRPHPAHFFVVCLMLVRFSKGT